MKNTEIKNCPFCGSNHIIIRGCNAQCTEMKDCEICNNSSFAVCCDFSNGGCGAEGGYRDTKELAIEAWNRRAYNEQREAD